MRKALSSSLAGVAHPRKEASKKKRRTRTSHLHRVIMIDFVFSKLMSSRSTAIHHAAVSLQFVSWWSRRIKANEVRTGYVLCFVSLSMRESEKESAVQCRLTEEDNRLTYICRIQVCLLMSVVYAFGII